MKIENSPSAWGFLAGAYFFLFAMIAAALSCAPPPVAPRVEPVGRSAYSVAIQVTCISPTQGVAMWAGSGVLLDEHRVLTAWHVGASCDGIAMIKVATKDGVRDATLDRVWLRSDVARLVLDGAPIVLPHLAFAAPRRGDYVCSNVAFPAVAAYCGRVQGVAVDTVCPDSEWCRNIVMIVVVFSGNSGGPVYNENGDLVALVTGGMFDRESHVPIGISYATDLWRMRDELRK